MATERQLAANRSNASKSTGPRSRAGRQRSSRNAYRHGLSLNISASPEFTSWEFNSKREERARQIAGDNANSVTLDRARAIAEAELDIVRVRHTRVKLIERVCAFGALDPPRYEVPLM